MNRSLSALASLALLASTAQAMPLTGSGANLPIASSTTPPAQARTAVASGSGWTGSWSAPAAAPWVGSFTATGPIPSGVGPTGITRYDFSSLPMGALSSGTYFRFGDVDGGSTQNETFTLLAWDVSGNLVTTPWLDGPIATGGVGPGGGAILPTSTPGWSWNAGTGEYFIDGSTVSGGNPSVSSWLVSNTDIAMLSVERTSDFANFSLAAPLIPSPGAAALFGLAGLTAARRRRR
jgi:MYXO-CTERM domain-containing protein